MRAFLVGMCDIFLILYLTAITNVQPKTVLTVDDFYTLKSMNEALKAEKQKTEAELAEELRRAEAEKERLAAEKKKQEELAAERLKEMEQSLFLSDAQRERINQELREKEKMLSSRENLLADLNREIAAKEEARRQMEQELEVKKEAVEASQQLARHLQAEAESAQQLADQMQAEAGLAYREAATAKDVQQKAIELKEAALKEKETAERRAAEALAAREAAEAEKERALQAMEAAKANKEKAEEKAQKLAETVRDIKQDGESAYTNNIFPRLQALRATYERKISGETVVYERELSLLPVDIGGKVYVIFPSPQIGFIARSDKAPDRLVIKYQGQRVAEGLINTAEDLIAVALPGHEGGAPAPYPAGTDISGLMPALLAVRNNGNVGLTDKIRGISESYFLVNRDYLEPGKDGGLTYAMAGFRGTGTHGERVVRGDQLVDLNGRLIGIAADPNRIIRVDTLGGWENIVF